MRDKVNEVAELSREIAELFADRERKVVGAVLAELLSIWLAAHFVANDEGGETKQFRKKLLREHMRVVRDLIPLNEKQILENLPKQ
jgi:hypothetical protein